jgi:hypothetical protein
MNPFLFLFGVNFLTGIALIATPYTGNVYLTCLFLSLAGLGTGFLSTGENTSSNVHDELLSSDSYYSGTRFRFQWRRSLL